MSVKMKNSDYVERADIGTRFFALLIDGFILGLITGLLFGVGREVGGGIGFFISFVYNWYFWTHQEGQTPGKRMLGIRVVRVDGAPLRDIDAAIRYVGYAVNNLFFIGWLWAFIDKEGRGWHDLLAGTIVVKA